MASFVLAFFLTVVFGAESAPETTPSPARPNKLEELMLWKMSDELRLTAVEEKKFSDLIRSLGRRKQELTQQLETDLESLKQSTSEKPRTAAVRRYRKTLESLQKLPLQEVDQIKALLGTERLGQYLDVKADLAGKVKALLVEKAERAGQKPLPPPKLIESGPPADGKPEPPASAR